ncbi:MAG: hypothetical protein LC791_09080 [Acidobacteria bacterium]|nr:hypothetical protein [Acidobacteriota bacterium]
MSSPSPVLTGTRPRQLVVERPSLTIERHTLTDVRLGGWAYGPELGEAPVVVVSGGITASPFPLGDPGTSPDDGREAWWPAMFGAGLIEPAHHTVLCPCWPGNGSTWRGFDDPSPPIGISVLGLACVMGCATATWPPA